MTAGSRESFEPNARVWPYVRLRAVALGKRRVSTNTQVAVLGYQPEPSANAGWIRLGNPSLNWTSAAPKSRGMTIYSGLWRPFDLGELIPVDPRTELGAVPKRQDGGIKTTPLAEGGHWEFKLALSPDEHRIKDDRDVLRPGKWRISLAIGSDESTARLYDAVIEWDPTIRDPSEALAYLTAHLTVKGHLRWYERIAERIATRKLVSQTAR